ncbi:hypothetical protein AAFN46_20220 [Pseudomonas sp. CAU 1711]|uniref:hypothetical protein n=1 Tax=Pseudomonas sp. CAU 1711 TaxID=3140356 RepID=UPI00326047CB
MEFKLGASLWGAAADAKPMATRQEPTEDFGRRLGLAARQEASAQEHQPSSEQRSAHEDQGEWQATLLQLARREGAHSPAQAELYGWGSLAGQHLSHLPGSFEAFGMSAAASPMAQARTPSQGVAAPSQSGQGPRAYGSAQSSAASLPLPGSPRSATESVALERGQLAAFLTQRWPERRLLLLPRDDGTEVIIRDFHLSEVEQRGLARDLQHLLQGSDEPLQRIWVNGQLVWQREPIQ